MISVVIPVYNEEGSILETFDTVKNNLDGFVTYEIIVVNDGSTDSSMNKIRQLSNTDVKIINHVENLGYGRTIYDGILAAKYNYIAIIDADGTYPAGQLKNLYQYIPQYDMVVGARAGKEFRKGLTRKLFHFLSEYASGRSIPDVNSGFRIFKKDIVLDFHDSLCAGFSFTTTLTLLFLLNQYYVKYVPIEFYKRKGKSKVKRFRDTLRAGQIITKVILYYNPSKLFLLLASINLVIGLILAVIYFSILKVNIIALSSSLLIVSFIPIFSMGLIGEQLKMIYKMIKDKR